MDKAFKTVMGDSHSISIAQNQVAVTVCWSLAKIQEFNALGIVEFKTSRDWYR